MRYGPKNAADAAAVNTNGIKTLLANCFSTFFIDYKPVFKNDPRNPPDCIILNSWTFDRLILACKLFPKAVWGFETWLSDSNNLCGKLMASFVLPIISDDNLRVIPV